MLRRYWLHVINLSSSQLLLSSHVPRSNSVTRQVSFNRTKIGVKCQKSKIQMRHFEHFSNNVITAKNQKTSGLAWVQGIKMCSNIARQIRSDNGARQEDKLTGCFTNDGALHPTSPQQQKVQWQILFFVLILIGSISIYGCQFCTKREGGGLKLRWKMFFIHSILPRDLFWTYQFEILIHYHLKGYEKECISILRLLRRL